MSKSKKGAYPIPFDKDGHLLSFPYNPHEWRDNYVFEGTLKYRTYYRGRSSATIDFEDSDGRTYEMFMSDFNDLMLAKGFNGQEVTGKWTFVKKGKNYGIKLAKEESE